MRALACLIYHVGIPDRYKLIESNLRRAEVCSKLCEKYASGEFDKPGSALSLRHEYCSLSLDYNNKGQNR